MARDISVREWIRRFDAGEFDSVDRMVQIEAGWYDWFCHDKGLRNKLYRMAPKVKQLAESSKINQDTMYVWFKNNCPMWGNLYDDFRFSDLETGEVLFTIVPRCGHHATPNGKKSTVYDRDNSPSREEFYAVQGKWKDVKEYFGV